MTNNAFEVNIDGLVGPTHNYAGLAMGNLASANNARSVSRPRQAALEGLAKMQFLHRLGLKQMVMLPHLRPDLGALRRVGFNGSDEAVIASAARQAPELLYHCYSASSMWVANAATISPSADTADGRVHFTPANLMSSFHRALEAVQNAALLKAMFPGDAHFSHHAPLPAAAHFSDEGAANHSRLGAAHGAPGVELFVYGKDMANPAAAPRKFPARQTRQASEAIARLHGLNPSRVVYAQQHPDAIDAGVFHNDVIAVANGNVLLYHEQAFLDSERTLAALREALAPIELHAYMFASRDVSLAEAVQSYLFNSQLVTLPADKGGTMALIAPQECAEVPRVKTAIDRLIADNRVPVSEVHYLNVRESMRNGGGPACLRLRVVLNEAEWAAVHPGVVYNDALHTKLETWVKTYYREELSPQDLADPQLLHESRNALQALEKLTGIGPVYQSEHTGG